MDDRPSGFLLHNLLLFGRLLRRLGMEVHAGRMVEVVRALEFVPVGRRRDFYHTLRALLVHRSQDLPLFDEAFRVFWRQPKEGQTRLDLRSLGEQRRYRQPRLEPPGAGGEGVAPSGEEEGREVDRFALAATYSPYEVLRTKDFARFTPEEMAQAKRLLAQLRWQVGARRTRRWVPGPGPVLHLRSAVRRSLRYWGEPLELPRRQRRVKARPLVLLCDISGSMEPYTRMLLHFIHTMAQGLGRVEAFLFATRLTRITRQLAHRGVDLALEEVARAVPDWAGGTRIGSALQAFNRRWARRVLRNGAVVMLISDGWDRGDPELLRQEVARLQRSCYRFIWLNPLLGSPNYQPLTRGMQTALPFVDDFLPVHNLASLEDLARHLNSLPPHRPARRQQWALLARPPRGPEPDRPPAPPPSPHLGANPTFRHPLWGR